MTVTESDWDAVIAAVTSADDIALACHVGPDGDALGSMLALGLALRARGARPVASWGGEPFGVPALYSYLPGTELLREPGSFPDEPALLITFDTGSVERLGSLQPHAAAAGTVVVVDHHSTNTRYGDLHLVDPAAAATAVLVEELIARLGVTLDRDMATCLYTGLSTDTGSFKFAATTPEVHALAGRLLATGIAHDDIARSIWDTNRFGYLKLLGTALDRAELVSDEELVWTWVSAADLDRHGVLIEEIEGAIDVIRTAVEAEIAVICKQAADGRWLVSMRSKGAVDLTAVAVSLGGGGHRYAAGYTADAPPEHELPRLRAALRAAPRAARRAEL